MADDDALAYVKSLGPSLGDIVGRPARDDFATPASGSPTWSGPVADFAQGTAGRTGNNTVSPEAAEMLRRSEDPYGEYPRTLMGPYQQAAYKILTGLTSLPERAFRAANPQFISDDPREQQQVMGDAALGVAGLMGGSPFRAGAGELGVFGGKLAARNKPGGQAYIRSAEEAERAGETPQAIYDSLGFYRGLDGKWRFEVPDTGARFAAEGSGPPARYDYLPDVLEHPKLYQMFPYLKSVKVSQLENAGPDVAATANPKRNQIAINYAGDPNRLTMDLLHEVQHFIQNKEGFAPGANALKLFAEQNTPNKSYVNALADYARSPGELEARMVEDRFAGQGPLARGSEFPLKTYRDEQRRIEDFRHENEGREETDFGLKLANLQARLDTLGYVPESQRSFGDRASNFALKSAPWALGGYLGLGATDAILKGVANHNRDQTRRESTQNWQP